jgi:predicted permease
VGPTYWEGAAPPSSVLGIGAKIPSAVFGPLSIVAFVVGTYCIHESNILNQITVNTINPAYIAGSSLVPISWGEYCYLYMTVFIISLIHSFVILLSRHARGCMDPEAEWQISVSPNV